jgi:hypothetical protein
MTLEEIWQELEKEPIEHEGYLKRRVDADLPLDLFLALSVPTRERMLLLLADRASVFGLRTLPSARGLDMRLVTPGEHRDAALEVVLSDARFQDVFGVLAGDVISSVGSAPGEREAVHALVARVDRWRRFFERAPEGLSASEQLGLFGELLFLQLLMSRIDPVRAVETWKGPEDADQDFICGPAAVEVKTTGTQTPQRVSVSSERQLDDHHFEFLGLFHVSVETKPGAGLSLPGLVDGIREVMRSDADASRLFAEKLIEAGYDDVHRHRYEQTGHRVRKRSLFHVTSGFPRLTASDLPDGVADVRYLLLIASCKDHAIGLDDLPHGFTRSDT